VYCLSEWYIRISIFGLATKFFLHKNKIYPRMLSLFDSLNLLLMITKFMMTKILLTVKKIIVESIGPNIANSNKKIYMYSFTLNLCGTFAKLAASVIDKSKFIISFFRFLNRVWEVSSGVRRIKVHCLRSTLLEVHFK